MPPQTREDGREPPDGPEILPAEIRPIRLGPVLTAVFGPFACRPAVLFALWQFWKWVTCATGISIDDPRDECHRYALSRRDTRRPARPDTSLAYFSGWSIIGK